MFLFLGDIDGQRIGTHVLENRGHVNGERNAANDCGVSRAGIDERGEQQGNDHHQLCSQDPGAAAAHRQIGITVHQRPVDELETPRRNGHPNDITNLADRGALGRHPPRHGEFEQADG